MSMCGCFPAHAAVEVELQYSTGRTFTAYQGLIIDLTLSHCGNDSLMDLVLEPTTLQEIYIVVAGRRFCRLCTVYTGC